MRLQQFRINSWFSCPNCLLQYNKGRSGLYNRQLSEMGDGCVRMSGYSAAGQNNNVYNLIQVLFYIVNFI